MELELGLTTIRVIAWSKVILFASVGAFLYLAVRSKKPIWYALLASATFALFYAIFSAPFETFFWGTKGDEYFVSAFLTRVLAGELFTDFYYNWLPPFYPPLYFWVTGTIAKPFVGSAVGAAKIGVLLTLVGWFLGAFLWQKLYWAKVRTADMSVKWVSSPWFWVVVPFVFFVLIDFTDIVLKPYETLPALFSVLFVGLVAVSLGTKHWNKNHYLFFGLTGGLLFLTYYFWWFILIPALFILAYQTKDSGVSGTRVVGIGIVMFIIATPYLLPLIGAFATHGMENWQAYFFIPHDFSTYAPWNELGLRGVLYALGLIGLIWHRAHPFVRANLIVLLVSFGYQFLNILIFLGGGKPVQSLKPFLFLSGAALAVGTSVLMLDMYRRLEKRYGVRNATTAAVVGVLLLVPLLPMVRTIDDPRVQGQIEVGQTQQGTGFLAENIRTHVPEYKDIVWFSSGTPDLNAYIPMTYYVAHNPHFSHQASIYSERLEVAKQLAAADSAKTFNEIVDTKTQPQITGLVLYTYRDRDASPILFWKDNWPNGGEELLLEFDHSVIDDSWELRHEDFDWKIYVRK